ncbi:MAG: prepilin peptidase [Candidatus Babeliales bacterium]
MVLFLVPVFAYAGITSKFHLGYVWLTPVFACWGSFLNVLSYRLMRDESVVKPRSRCPSCKHTLAWYDLIPVLSYVILHGHCRYCTARISPLYPFIEVLTVLVMSLLYAMVPLIYFPTYFIFFSALIVTIRSDLETMLISRFVTLFLIPLGIGASALGYLPITLSDSILGIFVSAGFLYAISWLFYKATGKIGIGQGDVELLAFIGAFTGIIGSWVALCIGSVLGSLIGIGYILLSGSKKDTKIPFGPFLAIGAIIYVLAQEFLIVYIST